MKSSVKRKSIKTKADPLAAAINFFAEAGLLKKVKRSGWWVAGIKDPESVAEHSFRCAVLAYYIAHAEGADVHRAMTMALFNDIHEARINDLHKMGHYYIDFKAAEKKVFDDQVRGLEERVRADMTSQRREYEAQVTAESIIARDADILECLLQAKEYLDAGHLIAKNFFQRAPAHLKTKTAQQFWRRMKSWDSSAWWENVVKFDR
ncbi:MAG: HD domain-containing protein [Candidatus Omnitrophica bacterium]|nr:HD domain-containing protein [Candidatus Omnitrophota bacterium]